MYALVACFFAGHPLLRLPKCKKSDIGRQTNSLKVLVNWSSSSGCKSPYVGKIPTCFVLGFFKKNNNNAQSLIFVTFIKLIQVLCKRYAVTFVFWNAQSRPITLGIQERLKLFGFTKIFGMVILK